MNDDLIWFMYTPSREAWRLLKAEVELEKDIEYQLFLDELEDIKLFEVGYSHES